MRFEKTQAQMKKVLGERAYDFQSIGNALREANLGHHRYQDLLAYAKREGLTVTKEELKLPGQHRAKYWIPASKLSEVLDGLDIPIRVEQLEALIEEREDELRFSDENA